MKPPAQTPSPARESVAPGPAIQQHFGDIDIYLFDQLARGRFDRRHRVVDVGCGAGRNLHYLLAHGYDCHGIDRDAGAIARVRDHAHAIGVTDADTRFVTGHADALPWRDQSFDAVICSAVLHFADDLDHFGRMVTDMWRVLAANGLFFARLASTIGLAGHAGVAGRRVRLPDGSDRFVVDEPLLLELTKRLGGSLAYPIKTTNVQQLRCMTTWCLTK
jgi:SAM-dependent methyltransferase